MTRQAAIVSIVAAVTAVAVTVTSKRSVADGGNPGADPLDAIALERIRLEACSFACDSIELFYEMTDEFTSLRTEANCGTWPCDPDDPNIPAFPPLPLVVDIDDFNEVAFDLATETIDELAEQDENLAKRLSNITQYVYEQTNAPIEKLESHVLKILSKHTIRIQECLAVPFDGNGGPIDDNDCTELSPSNAKRPEAANASAGLITQIACVMATQTSQDGKPSGDLDDVIVTPKTSDHLKTAVAAVRKRVGEYFFPGTLAGGSCDPPAGTCTDTFPACGPGP